MNKHLQLLTQYQDVFLCVCANRSLARAAQQLGITKSAVSQIISRLESSLGFMLFDRSRRPLLETAEAAALRGQLESSKGQLEQLLIELQSRNAIRPRIGIGSIESISQSCGIELIEELSQKSRQIDMMLGTVVSLFDLLSKGSIDVMFSWCSLASKGHVKEIPVLEQSNVIVIAKSKAANLDLTAPNKDVFRELCTCGLPMIVHPNFTFFPESVPAMLNARGYSFPRKFGIDGNLLQIELAAKGIGWCITQPLCFYPHLEFLDDVVLIPAQGLKRVIRLVSLANTPQTPADITLEAVRAIFSRRILPAIHRVMPPSVLCRLL